MARIRSFKDLKVWQLARQIRHKIYKITSAFPPEEKYNLVAQMRSAAVSMTSNIAEGFGRFFYRENQRACRVSRGEASELIDHIQTSLDEGYLQSTVFEELDGDLARFVCLLNGYIRSIGANGLATADDE